MTDEKIPLRIALDLRPIDTVGELHTLLSAAFALPPHYGRNWDALWDCLSELPDRPIEIDIYAFTALQEKLGLRVIPFFDVLHDFAQARKGSVTLRFHQDKA